MLVLSRRRILLMLCMTCLSLYAFSFKRTIKENQTVQTVALPSSNKIVIVDAGHGTPDERCGEFKWYYRSGN